MLSSQFRAINTLLIQGKKNPDVLVIHLDIGFTEEYQYIPSQGKDRFIVLIEIVKNLPYGVLGVPIIVSLLFLFHLQKYTFLMKF